MSKFNQAEYISSYHKSNIKQIKINLNKEYDADIIEHLSKQSNKQGYIKELIRKDIKKGTLIKL
mgnify:CR=1 FL=1